MIWVAQNWKLIAVAVVMAGCSLLGWSGRGWYEDSVDLAELRGAQAAIGAAMKRESEIAGKLETRLQELKANERVIERETIKIVNRPVYQSVCLDADGLRLINLSKGAATTKPADKVP